MSDNTPTRNLSEADRVDLARVIMSILDSWNLSSEQQITLLGLPEDTRSRHLVRYREGTVPLPEDEKVLERVENYLCINSALITSFPHNIAMARKWVTTPNRRFNNVTPLSIMLEHGMNGVYQIKGHLDCTENWF